MHLWSPTRSCRDWPDQSGLGQSDFPVLQGVSSSRPASTCSRGSVRPKRDGSPCMEGPLRPRLRTPLLAAPSQGGICLLSPSIWVGLRTCFGQQNEAEVTKSEWIQEEVEDWASFTTCLVLSLISTLWRSPHTPSRRLGLIYVYARYI